MPSVVFRERLLRSTTGKVFLIVDRVAAHTTKAEGHTVMVVPTELVPEILKLITKKRTA